VPWWQQDAATAIPECIRYTAFDSDVPSQRAQLAWPALLTRNARPDARGFEALIAERLDAERAWLDAWNAWHANRPHT
jgi:hypothetical protein